MEISDNHIQINRPFGVKYWLLIAGILIAVAAVFSSGFHHPDEHYQIVEFAMHYLSRSTDNNMPWEWSNQMRPSLQPMLMVGLLKTYEFLEIVNPFTQMLITRLLTGALTLAMIYQWNKVFMPNLGNGFAVLFFSFWIMPYFSVRFSSEILCMLTFGFGALLLHSKFNKNTFLFLSGVLLGISFQFRFQIAFAVIGVVLWLIMCKKAGWVNILCLVIGGLITLGGALLLDRVFYGTWTLPPVNYFYFNIIQNKAASFGTQPFWWYITEFIIKSFPPIGLLIIYLSYVGWRFAKHEIWVWAMVPFVLFHFMIAHKELRFLLPAIPAIILLVAHGWKHIITTYPRHDLRVKLLTFFFIINSMLLPVAVCLPAMEGVPYFEYIYDRCRQGPTNLYVTQNDPYKPVGIPLKFYMHPNLNIIVVEHFEDIKIDSSVQNNLILSYKIKNKYLDASSHLKSTYCFFPEWIQLFDFGGWQNRTRMWRIYKFVDDGS